MRAPRVLPWLFQAHFSSPCNLTTSQWRWGPGRSLGPGPGVRTLPSHSRGNWGPSNLVSLVRAKSIKRSQLWDLLGSPVVKTSPSSEGVGFDLWSGSYPPTCLLAKNPKHKNRSSIVTNSIETLKMAHSNMYILLYLQWITNKDLLYSTWNSAQCYVAAWMGLGFQGEWIQACVWLSLFTFHLELSQHG